MKFHRLILSVGLVALGMTSVAVHAQPTTSPGPATAQSAGPGALPSDGVVRKIDREQGKVTLKHGPIAALDMPSMTMVFKVAEPKLLEGLKVGDQVRFNADRVNGSILVTAIEAAK